MYVSGVSIRPDTSHLNTDVVLNRDVIIRCENLPNNVKETFADFSQPLYNLRTSCTISALLKIIILL